MAERALGEISDEEEQWDSYDKGPNCNRQIEEVILFKKFRDDDRSKQNRNARHCQD